MSIWCVVEDDRGLGSTILCAFTDKAKAEEYAEQSSHYYVEWCELVT